MHSRDLGSFFGNLGLAGGQDAGGLSKAMAEFFGPRLRWQGIMGTVSDAFVSYDHKGAIYHWNKAAERIFDSREPDYGA
jgi:hypothetical protein